MKMNKNITSVVADLEYIIGSQCYNPNSYNGWTGEEGCAFRYPVYTATVNPNGAYEAYKYRGKIDDLSVDEIATIKYKFGSNHLYIGEGITKMLNYLENRYGISFEELEKTKTKKVA